MYIPVLRIRIDLDTNLAQAGYIRESSSNPDLDTNLESSSKTKSVSRIRPSLVVRIRIQLHFWQESGSLSKSGFDMNP